MTYGCQTWSLNKQLTNKQRNAQRAIERNMLHVKLQDEIVCSEIRKRTKVIDIIEYTLKQKWRWDGNRAIIKKGQWLEIMLQSDNQGEGRVPTTMHGKICDAGHVQAPVRNYFIPDIDSYRFIPFQRVKTRTTHL